MAHNEALKCNAQRQQRQRRQQLQMPLCTCRCRSGALPLTEAFLWLFRESIWRRTRACEPKKAKKGQHLAKRCERCCWRCCCCGLRKLTKASRLWALCNSKYNTFSTAHVCWAKVQVAQADNLAKKKKQQLGLSSGRRHHHRESAESTKWGLHKLPSV